MELIAVGLIIFASGLVQGLAGFGSALVCMALLPFIMDLKMAVPLAAANAVIINIINYYSSRQHFAAGEFMALLIGATMGIPIGIMILKFTDPAIIKRVLGSIIVVYSLYCLLRKNSRIMKLSPVWAYITGIIAGITGGSCSVNGPPVIIYLTKKYTDKHRTKAILASFFLAAGIINVIMFAINGLYTASVCKYSIGFAVFTILGVLIGNRYCNKINHDLFKKLIYFFLTASGAFMILGSYKA
ncbi:MAG: sulfite exporter TauE/SafE family protein [Victivallales bacterium]|nr:sulfite exporter TauE/SafE family protein [Victivallales bacterium]